jgi:hypothetical protein
MTGRWWRAGVSAWAVAALAACSAGGDKPNSAGSTASKKGPGLNKSFPHDPFPSTYRAYPGVPTLVTNATVIDGEGGLIERGSVLFADGKVVAIGQTLSAPAGATVIDAGG